VTVTGGGTVAFNYNAAPTLISSSSAGAGLVINGSTMSMIEQKTAGGGSSGTTNYLGANTALTMAGSTLSSGEAASSGNHRQTFSSLTIGSGFSSFQLTARGSSSGNSVGFTTLARNPGGVADFAGPSGTTAFGGSVNTYALPGTTVTGYATINGGIDWALPKGAATDLGTATYVADTWAAANETNVITSSSPASGSTTHSLRFGGYQSATYSGTSGTNTITVNSNTGMQIGAFITGTGIPAGTTISNISGTTITLSANLTAAATNQTANFGQTITGATLTLSGTNIVSTGGILNTVTYSPNSAQTITGGSLTSGNGSDLIVINNSTQANGAVVINSSVVDNGGTPVGITKAGVGQLQLGGTNTFTGPSYFNNGTTVLTSANAWNGQGSLNFAPSGSLATAAAFNLNGNSITVGGLSTTQTGMNPIVQNANASSATLTVSPTGTTTFGGTLQNGTGGGTLGLTKANSGTLVLTRASTYTGNTNINAGTLALSGSGSIANSPNLNIAGGAIFDVTGLTNSTYSLGATQTLAGNGTALGTMSTGGGSTISPGISGLGTLTSTGLSVNPNAVFNFQIGGGNDQYVTTGSGALLLNANGGNQAVVNLLNTVGGGQFSTTGKFDLIQYNGSIGGSGSIAGLTAGNLATGFNATFGTEVVAGQNWIDVTVVTAAVPEWNLTTGGTWNDANSWNPTGIPSGAGQAVLFGTKLATAGTVTLDAAQTVGAITFTNASASYTIDVGSGSLTFDGNGSTASISDTAGSHTILAPMTLNSNLSINITNAGDTLTLAGALNDGGAGRSLTLNGAGTLVLVGNNTYGATNILGGTLQIGDGVNTTGTLGSGAALSNGTLVYNVGGSGTGTIGPVSGTGSVIKNGGTTLNLSGINTFSGALTINGGTVNLSTANTFGGAVVNNGGTLAVGGGGALGGSLALNNGGTVSMTAAGTLTVSNAINLAAGATGTLTSSNTGNLYAGTVTFGDGTSVLNLTGQTSFNQPGSQFSGSGKVTITNGGTLRFSSTSLNGNGGANVEFNIDSTSTLTTRNNGAVTLGALSGTGTLTSGSNAATNTTYTIGGKNIDTTFSGAITQGTDPVVITKTGTGTLTLDGISNTYTGVTTISGGTLKINNTSGSATGSGPVNVNSGGTLAGTGIQIGSTSPALVTINSGGHIAPGDNLVNGGVGTLTVDSLTLNAGSVLDYHLVSAGNNSLINVTTPNGLTINGGAVNLMAAGGSSAFTTSGTYNLIQFTGGIGGTGTGALGVVSPQQFTNYTFGTDTSNPSQEFVQVTIANNPPNFWNVNADGTWETSGNWSLNSVPDAVTTFAGFGGGPTAITGPVTVTLNGGHTVGTLSFNNAASFTLTGSVISLDNGTVSAPAITDAQGSHTIASNVNVTSTGPTINVVNAGDTLTISGDVSGGSNITKTGAGTLVLSGSNGGYSGTATVSAGVLRLGSANALANSPLVVNGSGSVSFATGVGTFNVASIANAGPLALQDTSAGAITLAVGANNSTFTYANQLSGPGGLAKNGAGTLTLTAVNSFAGDININGGVLAVSAGNTNGGAVNVNSGATLTLNSGGGVGGTITLNGGTLNMTPTSNSVFPGNTLVVPAGATGNITSAGQANGIGGLVNSGDGTSILTVGPNVSFSSSNVKQLQGFTGTVQFQAGGSIRFSGQNSSNGGDFATFDLGSSGNLFPKNSGIVSLGALVGQAGSTLSGTTTAGNIATYQIGLKNIPTEFDGTINGTGTIVTKVGTADLTLGGANTYTGNTNVNGGSLTIAAAGSLPATTNVTANAALIFNNASQTIASLSGATTGSLTLNGTALTVTNGSNGGSFAGAWQNGSSASSITVSGGTMTFGGPVASNGTVNANATTVFTGNTGTTTATLSLGALNVAGGVTASISTSALAGTPTQLTLGALNLIGAPDSTAKIDLTNNILVGPGMPSDGENLIDRAGHAASVLTSTSGLVIGYGDAGGGNFKLRATLLGDSDLDGKVNVADLANLAGNFGKTAGQLWINGDFDYNGNVNVADLADLAGNFGVSLPGSGSSTATSAAAPASISAAAASAAVPEPASTGLLLATSAATLIRRRRRRCRG
jgi:autotransporter-associated beta strand protein